MNFIVLLQVVYLKANIAIYYSEQIMPVLDKYL
jgi:hypothetical protein